MWMLFLSLFSFFLLFTHSSLPSFPDFFLTFLFPFSFPSFRGFIGFQFARDFIVIVYFFVITAALCWCVEGEW